MSKGTPIHIMRWAPADYVNDPIVKLALARRDLVASTFYPLFLFHAFMEGGSLPADRVLLAAIVAMKVGDVERAVAFWAEHGKLQEDGGRLFHKRVVREIARELEYREEQAVLGRMGGKAAGRGRPLSGERGTPLDSIGPPAPSPSSAPAPNASASALAPEKALASSPIDPEREDYVRQVWASWCVKRGGELPEPRPVELQLARALYDDRVPLRIALRAIADCSKPPRGPSTPLQYVEPAFHEAARHWRRSQTA